GEFAQNREWNHDLSLDWHLLEDDRHKGMQKLVRDLNHVYRELPALHQLDCDSKGFEWIEAENQQQSILVYLRKGYPDTPPVLVVVNLTPAAYSAYQLGVPRQGHYRECLNTDSEYYGGSNMGNVGGVQARAEPWGGQPCQLSICIPPLATLIFEWQAG
ncbi:MAG: alpha amylase C-terminal domain-containing protein, partial [Lysobacterales bacterium]